MGLRIIRDNIYGFNVAIELCCALFSVIFILFSFMKRKKYHGINPYTYVQCASVLAMIADIITYLTGYSIQYHSIFVMANSLSYMMVVMYSVLFYESIIHISEKQYGRFYDRLAKVWALVYGFFISAVYISSYWTKIMYEITPESEYYPTQYAYLSGLMIMPIGLAILMIIIENRKEENKGEIRLYFVFITLILIAGIIDAEYTTTLHYLILTIFNCLLFLQEELELEKDLQRKNQEILYSELNALRLQMNPHYIYNTLASIDGLCMFDPEKARQLIASFIKHLRGSYLTEMPEKISVKKELENLRYYLEVESTRFPFLKVKYNIKADDFLVPPLVIQPIVENAIKHGICSKDDSDGTVTIETFENGDYHIKIYDDGVGFDVNNINKEDGRSHVGIANARKRLELLCNGSMTVQSIVDFGTVVEIIIPKEQA